MKHLNMLCAPPSRINDIGELSESYNVPNETDEARHPPQICNTRSTLPTSQQVSFSGEFGGTFEFIVRFDLPPRFSDTIYNQFQCSMQWCFSFRLTSVASFSARYIYLPYDRRQRIHVEVKKKQSPHHSQGLHIP